MWSNANNEYAYLSQLSKTFKPSVLLNHIEFYTDTYQVCHSYKTAPFLKKYSEICMVSLQSGFVNLSNFVQFDKLSIADNFILAFSKQEYCLTLLGGALINKLFQGPVRGESLDVHNIPTVKVHLNNTESQRFLTVISIKNSMIPRKCKIVKIGKKLWMTIGGTLGDEVFTNKVCLIKFSLKQQKFFVWDAQVKGVFTGRTNHAVTHFGDFVYVHGGETLEGISDDLYCFQILRADGKAVGLIEKIKIVVRKVIASGINSSMKNHAIGCHAGYIYAFAGIVKGDIAIVIRKINLATNIWEEVEKSNNLSWMIGSKVKKSYIQLGPLFIISLKDKRLSLVYDSHLKTASKITDVHYDNVYSILHNNYYIIYCPYDISLGQIVPNPYYNIRPVSYNSSTLSQLLLATLNVPSLSNVTILTKTGSIQANILILLARGSESKSLLSSMKKGNIDIHPNFDLHITQAIIKYLYTDEFPDGCDLEELTKFANYYNMSNLKDLCLLSITENIINSQIILMSELAMLCPLTTILRLQHSSSLDQQFISYLDPDFIVNTQNSSIPCHKLFLYIRSGYLRHLLNFNPSESSINIVDFSQVSVEKAIEYCYGPIEIDLNIIGEVLALARYLDMPGLFLLCQEKISINITGHNFLEMYLMAKTLQADELMRYLKDFACNIWFSIPKNSGIIEEELNELIELRKKKKLEKQMRKNPKKFLNLECKTDEELAEMCLKIHPIPSGDEETQPGLKNFTPDPSEYNNLVDWISGTKKDVKFFTAVLDLQDDEADLEVDEPNAGKIHNRFQVLDDDDDD